jgi:tetratricopeptide (TPR) repeat protein
VSRRANGAVGEDYFKKGKAEQLAGAYPRAIELYTLAGTCKANYFQAYCNMGYCYRALGKFGEAKRSYQSALASNPDDPISHYNLANLYRVIGENELAIEEYSQVIALKQQGASVGTLYLDSLVNIGICFKNRGEIDEAIRVNRKVLEVDPAEASATFNLAICLLNSIEDKNSPLFHKFYHERAAEAEGLFLAVLRKTPDSIMAQFCLTKVSAILDPSHKNLEEAIARLKELLTNPKCDIKDEISQDVGRCLNLLKKFDESARYYENSVGSITRKVSQKPQKENNKIDNIFEPFSQEDIPENDILDSSFLT